MATQPGQKKNRSAMKRVRQAEKRRLRNRHVVSTVKTAIKAVDASLAEKDIDGAREKLRRAIKTIDMARSKGVLHRNTAARRVSRLTKRFNQAVSAAASD